MKLKIMHLYPDLLDFFGDSGNIEALKHRLVWRGINVEVAKHNRASGELDLSDTDIVFLGGGGEREEKLVMELLRKNRDRLKEYIENDGAMLAVCGGFDMLGKYVKYGTEIVSGADLLDIYTDYTKKRASGDIILNSSLYTGKIVGFENRTGKTYTNGIKPLGTVEYGTGNNGEDKTEGAIYRNVIGTHLHGPLLPKNPMLCDYILEKALQKKYLEFEKLSALSTEDEDCANSFIVERYL